jgi:ribonuclease HII
MSNSRRRPLHATDAPLFNIPDFTPATFDPSSPPNADFEEYFRRQGRRRIAGVDEVGRGAWAGPVVAAAVILAPDAVPAGLNDSKKLSPGVRAALYEVISAASVAQAFGEADEKTIDRINILEATRVAMRLAVDALSPPPDGLLIDAVRLPNLAIPQQSIIKGDARSVSIAAASILAKVHRDRFMIACDVQYPGYGFARHKGYGTSEHRAALEKLGPCPIHRLSFRGVRRDDAEQNARPIIFAEGTTHAK